MYSDYIITVDENGEPYIAHWFGLGHKNPPRNHKYVAKIKTPRGIRYFYTNADLKAYYFNQRVKNKIKGLFSQKKPSLSPEGIENTITENIITENIITENTSKKDSKKDSNSNDNNRPSSHKKKVTGTAEKGSIYKRGDGLGLKTDSSVHGSFQQDSKTGSNKDPKADSSAYYAKREDEASIRKKEREFAKLGDRWRDLIREERKIRNSSKVKNAWERYSRYIDKYGKNSSQAKWAEQEYIKVTKPIRDIEEELRDVWEQTNHQPCPW